ncbi:LLM class flavin-dependent oxidoreductase [Jiangella anatolica]|uniref:LLM class flavin-dependent oxidoreductase n=1 Tax=Jiangella anatolica TaxID=2670374 RepID=A0A2W2BHD0_9ACTN|nr:LLM class flavin-dependent oxidoreductase [Jiangella anatolica]PZF79708.1 LLM class flavin-dependent oxidoreductase [Jiangella anatolica]
MTDYGRPLSFGVSLDPTAADVGSALDLARQADRAGLEYLAVQDHAYQPGYLDMWTMLSWLAAATERIAVVPDVADLQLRPPTMLAKAAASLATIAPGRVVLGVGAGPSAAAVASMGATPHHGDAMVEYTEEAIGILRAALAGQPIRTTTEHHHIAGYQAGPRPPRPVEIWVGAQKPKMLGVTGRAGDGWVSPLNIYVPPDDVPQRQALVDDAARSAGRNPRDERRLYNVIGAIGPYRGGQGLVGPVELWVDRLTEWAVGLGFDTFVLWTITDPAAQLQLFTSEVVPAVRERVAAHRAG